MLYSQARLTRATATTPLLLLFFLILDVNPIKIPAGNSTIHQQNAPEGIAKAEIRLNDGGGGGDEAIDPPQGETFTHIYPLYHDSGHGQQEEQENALYLDSNDTDSENYNDSFPTQEEILEFIYPKSWTWALIFFHCIVFLIGLVGNCLVCVAVYRNHSMRTVTNYFIVNLAAADFLVILFCLPPSVVWDVTSTWWFGSDMCKIVLYLQEYGKKLAEVEAKIHATCINQTGANEQDIEASKKGKFSNDIKFKKYLTCFLVQIKTFDPVTRKFDFDLVFEMSPPHLKQSLTNSVRKCYNEFKDLDVDDMSRELFKCYYLSDPDTYIIF